MCTLPATVIYVVLIESGECFFPPIRRSKTVTATSLAKFCHTVRTDLIWLSKDFKRLLFRLTHLLGLPISLTHLLGLLFRLPPWGGPSRLPPLGLPFRLPTLLVLPAMVTRSAFPMLVAHAGHCGKFFCGGLEKVFGRWHISMLKEAIKLLELDHGSALVREFAYTTGTAQQNQQ